MNCIYPNCSEAAEKDNKWCFRHYGLYPHKCEDDTCDRMSQYDDEPYCFTHSPDEGSSVRGYSAYERTLASK